MKRILIVKLRPLGETLLAGPCFEAVREAYPKAQITALVQSPANQVLLKSGWVDEVFSYHQGAIDRRGFFMRAWKHHQLASALQKRYFDLAIDLSGTHRSAQIVSWAKPVLKVGLGLPSIKRLFDVTAYSDDISKVPTTELDGRVLHLIGLEPKPHDRPEGYLHVPAEAYQYAGTFWKANRFTQDDMVIAINPFAGRPTKEWYPAKWAVVIKELLDNGLKPFFTCAPLEKPKLSAIEKEMKRSIPTYSQPSIVPLLGLYKHSKAVISADSAPRHLAAAVGTPTLTLWGPETVSRWHPYSQEHHPIVIQEVPCRPCGLSVCLEKKHECMVALQPADVVKALKPLLRKVVKA